MAWSFSVIWMVAMISYVLASPYIAIIPTREEAYGDYMLPATADDSRSEESGEMEGPTSEQSLRADCRRLIRLYDRLHSESGTYAILAEGQINDNVLEACARFLLSTNRASPFVAITRDLDSSNWTVKRAARSYKTGSAGDAQTLQRRAYDYIRFGKRLMEAANKRMQSSTKNANRKAGTHEYIRFGKK